MSADAGQPARITAISQVPGGTYSLDANWFGYYGKVDWSALFDWWQAAR